MVSYNFFLSHKFIGKKKENFLSFISFVSIAGISLGIISLMLVIGVMNGFSNDLKRKIVGANPTITIEGRPVIKDYNALRKEIFRNIKEAEGVSPYISSQVIYKSRNYLFGGIIKGIDPEYEPTVTNILDFLKEGNLADLNNGIILGSELAKELEVKTGDYIWIMGGLPARQEEFKVVGIVECGVYNYDVSMGFTSLHNIQKFFKMDDFAYRVGVRIKDIYRSEKVAKDVRNLIHFKYPVSTWIQKNKVLFAALALEKKAMTIILILIILVASFNIASTLMITVFRKTKEIGVLKAIGLSSREIRKIFFYQGLVLGTEGLVLGLSIGGILAYFLKKYQFIKLPEFIYNLSRLPIEISLADILFISIGAIIIVSIASIYPAQRAANLNPAEALRYE